MSVGEWIGAIIGGLTFLAGLYFSARALQSATRTDQRVAAEALATQIRDARAEERAACDGLVEGLRRDIDQLGRERDYQRARADSLQDVINKWRIGQGG